MYNDIYEVVLVYGQIKNETEEKIESHMLFSKMRKKFQYHKNG